MFAFQQESISILHIITVKHRHIWEMEWFVYYTQSVTTACSLFISFVTDGWIWHDYSNEIISKSQWLRNQWHLDVRDAF